MKKKFLYKILFPIFLFFAVSFAVFAAETYVYVAPTPPEISYSGPAEYIKSLYNWGIGIVGILALVQLIRGGILYMVSGAIDQKNAGKDHIQNALIGLGLALASYLILNTINPTLLELKEPTIQTNFGSTTIRPPAGTSYTICGTTAKNAIELQGFVCTHAPDKTAECPTTAQPPYTCSSI